MGASSENAWTPQEIEELKRLHSAGLGPAAIAREMGGGRTRNAVIGKLNRLGLSEPRPKPAPTSHAPPRPRPQRLAPFRKAPEPRAKPLPEPEEEPSGGIPFLDREDGFCSWPMAPGFVCGGPVIEVRKPYCAFHTRRSLEPKRGVEKRPVTVRDRRPWVLTKRR